jgi:hypothetical protein
MPEKKTRERARNAKAKGKSASTQAGEYVREEIEHVREGKHGAKSAKQAIAIGLSKARRDGVKTKPPKNASKETKEKAKSDTKAAGKKTKSTTRSRASSKALKKESTKTTSRAALSRQAKSAASKRTATSRSKSAKKGAATRKRSK